MITILEAQQELLFFIHLMVTIIGGLYLWYLVIVSLIRLIQSREADNARILKTFFTVIFLSLFYPASLTLVASNLSETLILLGFGLLPPLILISCPLGILGPFVMLILLRPIFSFLPGWEPTAESPVWATIVAIIESYVSIVPLGLLQWHLFGRFLRKRSNKATLSRQSNRDSDG